MVRVVWFVEPRENIPLGDVRTENHCYPMIDELDLVVLKRDLPNERLAVGDVGTVVLARLSLPKQKSLQYQGGSPKSFHYRAGTAAWTIWPPVAIRGRGCTGRSSLSCFTSNF